MTAEREAMTLEQVRDFCRLQSKEFGYWHEQRQFEKMADAIDRYLSRAAEPVATILPQDPEFPAPEADLPIFSATAWKRLGALPPRTNLYTVSPETARDVTDAMVERGLQAARDASDARLPRYKVVRAILDAAMAQESGDGE